MGDMSRFSDNLKRARQRAGKTQAWMAQRLHIHRTTYTKYELGLAEPSLDGFYALVKALDVDPLELLE